MTIFHSATIRLTFWYLLILMILSGLFSVVLYRVSTHEFDREIRRSQDMRELPLFVPRGFDEFRRLRITQVEESKHHIQTNLIYFNLIILGIGGAVSFFLAKRTLEPIEEALNAQNRFTADASHELRTPLTAIKTEIEVALRNKDLSVTESRNLFKSNLEEIQKLENLTNGLLKLAVSENKSPRLAFETCNIQAIIQKSTTKVEPLARAKAITLHAPIAEEKIEGDCESLAELFTILLDNAIKYSPENSTVTIATKSDPTHNRITITVADQGVGITSLDLPHIFDRFYRADSSRSKQHINGYGLGLSIAKKIVSTHHGTIQAESQPGKGTKFVVKLPLSQN